MPTLSGATMPADAVPPPASRSKQLTSELQAVWWQQKRVQVHVRHAFRHEPRA